MNWYTLRVLGKSEQLAAISSYFRAWTWVRQSEIRKSSVDFMEMDFVSFQPFCLIPGISPHAAERMCGLITAQGQVPPCEKAEHLMDMAGIQV